MRYNQPYGHATYKVSFDNGKSFHDLENVHFQLNDQIDNLCLYFELRTTSLFKSDSLTPSINDIPLIIQQKIREDIGFCFKLYIVEARLFAYYNLPEILIKGYILEMECLHCSQLNKQMKEYTEKGMITIPDTELVL
jgi:hypothetical protein